MSEAESENQKNRSPEDAQREPQPSDDASGTNPETASETEQERNEGLSETAGETAETASETPPADSPTDADELPEEEELTPELVEEEAIRGDFMLRWAAIFLAVLFGFSQIAETRSLVHIRTGDAMRASGFLPSGTDPHSYALENQSTSNVSWLFDHVVSAVYALGGENGLTVFKALTAGLVAWLLCLISLRGMPTWWNSICCVLAVAACSIDFLPVTDLATLVGLTVVLLMLHRHAETKLSGFTWKIALTIAIWANFDPRAWLGVLAVALFATGSQIQRSLSQSRGDSTAVETGPLWKAAAFGLVALLINPSPLASLTSVITTYAVEYPTMAAMNPLTDSNGQPLSPAVLLDGRTEYFPLWVPEVLRGFEFAYVSGLALLLIAAIVLLIARNREDLPWAATLIGFTCAAVFAVHELPAASLVAAATAGIAAQRWYGRTFRQEYTVRPSEVLFSRGGRAVTVFAFAALGFCAVADRLPTRTPIGMGFEADTRTTMDSVGTQLADLPEQTRVLPTVMAQGDLLIWHGRQTYVDSRATHFGSYHNEASPIHQFDAIRWSIVGVTDETAAAAPLGAVDAAAGDTAADRPESVSPRPTDPDWKSHLTDMGVTHAMIRLAPPGPPAYTMATRLLESPDWVMTQRGPSALFFELASSPENRPEQTSSRMAAFLESESEDMKQIEFAREPDFYKKYVYADRITLSAPTRDAQHYLNMDCRIPPETVYQIAVAAAAEPENQQYMNLLGSALAGPIMAVRRANQALVTDPQDAIAHRLLGAAYDHWNNVENAVSGAFNGNSLTSVRYMQAIMALQQSATIDPTAAATWDKLMGLYQQNGRTGLARECLDQLLALEEERLLADPRADAQLRQMYEMQRTWTEQSESIQTQVDEFLAQEMPEDPQQHAQQKLSIVQQLYNDGHVRIALKIMKDNVDLLRPFPQAELLRGQMLLEVGELEDGAQVLNLLAAAIQEQPNNPGFAGLTWHLPVALSRLASADYPGAVDVWDDQLSLFARVEKSPELSRNMMTALPLIPDVESRIGGQFPNWPLMHLQTVQLPMGTLPASAFEPQLLRAVANIESGNVANARFILEGLITSGGDSELRPLAEIYLQQLSDEASKLIAASRLDPWEDFQFSESTDDQPAGDAVPENEAGTDADKPAGTDDDAGKKQEADSGDDEAGSKAKEDSQTADQPEPSPKTDASR
ncbi:MAG: hypothetical protein RIK87_25050 [Fuerstiella sp.]